MLLLQLSLIGLALLFELSGFAFFGQNALVSVLFCAAIVPATHRPASAKGRLPRLVVAAAAVGLLTLHLALWASAS